MSGPRVYIVETIDFPKQAILDALKLKYPDEFGDKTLLELESYGPVQHDSTFMEFVFMAEDVDLVESNQTIIRFEQGDILTLLQTIAPQYFKDKTIDQLETYYDDPDNPAVNVRFVFKEEKQ